MDGIFVGAHSSAFGVVSKSKMCCINKYISTLFGGAQGCDVIWNLYGKGAVWDGMVRGGQPSPLLCCAVLCCGHAKAFVLREIVQ